MSARINKKRLGAAAVILLLLFFVVGGVSQVVKDPEAGADDSPPPTAPSECASQVHFFAVDTPNNFFGPASDGDVAKQKAELKYRRCLDPSLVVAHAYAWGIPGFAELNGDEQFAQKTRDLINNREAWRFVVSVMEELEGASQASIENMSGPYQTLYMLDGLTDVPLIRKAAPDRPSFEVIRFVHPDGRVVNLKLDCGFQPVAQDFPGIPPVEAAPPSGQPAPPSTPQGPPPPTTGDVPKCPNGQPIPPDGVCPKNQNQNIDRNPDLPPQIGGEGTTPVGVDPGPPTAPVDSPSGCLGPCPTTPPPAPPAPGVTVPVSNGGNTGVTAPPTSAAPPAPPVSVSPQTPVTSP